MDDAHVQALVETWRKRLEQQMTEMRLRQWCVERAIEANSKAMRQDDQAIIYDVPMLANALLKFVSAPFAEIFQTNISEP